MNGGSSNYKRRRLGNLANLRRGEAQKNSSSENSVSSPLPKRKRNVTAQVLGRSEREVQLESSLQSMKAKLAGLQGEFDAMKSQMSLMMSMMQQRPQDIGTTPFAPPSAGTPYPTHIATPREGGSHSRCQLPPYDQFGQGDDNDSDEDDG